jgi:uncharacterized protein with von Willebrand factor type A (vWA) domain
MAMGLGPSNDEAVLLIDDMRGTLNEWISHCEDWPDEIVAEFTSIEENLFKLSSLIEEMFDEGDNDDESTDPVVDTDQPGSSRDVGQ